MCERAKNAEIGVYGAWFSILRGCSGDYEGCVMVLKRRKLKFLTTSVDYDGIFW